MVSIDGEIDCLHLLVAKIRNRSKVDPSGFQPGLVDSPGAGGPWQGPPPPGSQPPLQTQQSLPHPPPPPGHLIHPGHPHHPGVGGGRIPLMPPRDLHFPPQHMRGFRPSLPPPPSSPEYRMHDFNKRLSMRTEDCDNQWWDAFVTEFFEDDATLTISICLEDGPKRFSIGRLLIPRYFRTLFDSGVNDVYFVLKQTKEIFHNPTISLDSEQTSMVTCFGKPSHIKVCTDGHLIVDFTFDDLMRIKTWHFAIKQFRELIPRSVVAVPTDNSSYLDQLSKNITRSGLTSAMLNFLRLCEILEPMQELMSRHKTTTFSPRDCLKTILHQRWSKTCSDFPLSPQAMMPSLLQPCQTDTRPPAKPRRKRKSTAANSNTAASNNANNSGLPPGKDPNINHCVTPSKKRSPANAAYSQSIQAAVTASNPNVSNMPGDVMIVGEPSLMGGEMDDEDERFITRLENTQYDPAAAAASHHPPHHLPPPNPHGHQFPSGYLPPPPHLHPPPPPSLHQQHPNANLQALLHKPQQFGVNPQQQQQQQQLVHPHQMKREHMSFPGSPQPQQQQQLPSMFSTGPSTPSSGTQIPPPSTPLNGELKRIPTTPSSSALPNANNNSSSSPPTPSSTNHNQNPSTPAPTISTTGAPTTPTTSSSSWNGTTPSGGSSSSSSTTAIAEKKQEPHTPPATPQQQTIATAS